MLDKTFESLKELAKGDYECCEFRQCDFSNHDFSDFNFIDCEFVECDLSSAKITRTGFKEVRFDHCKLQGLQFCYASDFLFQIDCENSNLRAASFYQMNLKKQSFANCEMEDVDFVEADLTEAKLLACKLKGTLFEMTNLSGADFTGSSGFDIDPEKNRLKGAKFSINALPGLLIKHQIKISS